MKNENETSLERKINAATLLTQETFFSHLKLTMCSRWAGTHEAVNEVDASSSVEARLRVALIDIIFTVYPLVARFALHQ